MTGQTAQLVDSWIDTALLKASAPPGAGQLTSVWQTNDEDDPVLIARGYEFTRVLTTLVEDREVTWTERVQVVQPLSLLESQKDLLEKRLQRAEQQLLGLTLAGKGRRVWSDEAELRQATVAILQEQKVEGLLVIDWDSEVRQKKRYGKPGRPRRNWQGKHDFRFLRITLYYSLRDSPKICPRLTCSRRAGRHIIHLGPECGTAAGSTRRRHL